MTAEHLIQLANDSGGYDNITVALMHVRDTASTGRAQWLAGPGLRPPAQLIGVCMAKLVLSLNGKVVNQYFIDKPSITIGSGTGNDIAIEDTELKPAHLSIVPAGSRHHRRGYATQPGHAASMASR